MHPRNQLFFIFIFESRQKLFPFYRKLAKWQIWVYGCKKNANFFFPIIIFLTNQLPRKSRQELWLLFRHPQFFEGFFLRFQNLSSEIARINKWSTLVLTNLNYLALNSFLSTLAATAFLNSCSIGSLTSAPLAKPLRSSVGFRIVLGGKMTTLFAIISSVMQSPSLIPSFSLMAAGIVIFSFWTALTCSPSYNTYQHVWLDNLNSTLKRLSQLSLSHQNMQLPLWLRCLVQINFRQSCKEEELRYFGLKLNSH